MSKVPTSGKEVVDKFFEEIMNIEGVDTKTVEKLIYLHTEGKLSDTHIQNAMDQLLQEELDKDGR